MRYWSVRVGFQKTCTWRFPSIPTFIPLISSLLRFLSTDCDPWTCLPPASRSSSRCYSHSWTSGLGHPPCRCPALSSPLSILILFSSGQYHMWFWQRAHLVWITLCSFIQCVVISQSLPHDLDSQCCWHNETSYDTTVSSVSRESPCSSGSGIPCYRLRALRW